MDIRELPGEEWEKEECKHAHIKSGHLLKIRVINTLNIPGKPLRRGIM
jgi:hypothetical protein